MNEEDVLVSVIVPVKNGDAWLEGLLVKLREQTLFARSEIIVIDSGSTDRSKEIISRHPVRLIEIPGDQFNHGDTRNLGARTAKGRFVVMTVQDALPCSNEWLALLLSGFVNDHVAGVCGQQVVPHDENKNPVLWFRPVSAPQRSFVHFDDPAAFLKLSPAAQRQQASWDNVTAAYRRDILLAHPFPCTDFAEDISWAKSMLLKGYTLGFVDEARVFHYHHHLPDYILPRYFAVYYFEYKIFGLKPAWDKSMLFRLLVAAKILMKDNRIGWADKVKWEWFNVQYWFSVKKTIRLFNKALQGGDASLDAAYQQICGKVPQAPKY